MKPEPSAPPPPATPPAVFEDDADTPRPRWMGVALALCVVLLVLGLLMTSVFIMRNYALAPAPQGEGPRDAGSAAALALVQGSDCLRCHLPARKAVGPGWQAIAERHADNPDAVALLARKIREGSVGDWGRVIMPRHPQVTDADARVMAQWVLAQRPASAPGPRPANP